MVKLDGKVGGKSWREGKLEGGGMAKQSRT